MTEEECFTLPPSHVVECFRQPPLRSRPQIWCFPHAGAGASAFTAWPAIVGAHSNALICAIRLAGRENRLDDLPFFDIADLVEALAAEISDLVTLGAIFYGQCYGAIVAFELVRHLAASQTQLPMRLYAASQIAPRHLHTEIDSGTLPDDAQGFRDAVRQIGGIESSLEDDDLWELVEPAIRADHKVLSTYAHSYVQATIPVPITAVIGAGDARTPKLAAMDWRDCTSNSFTLAEVGKGHFLNRTSATEIINLLVNDDKQSDT